MTGERANQWQQRYDESMIEMARQLEREDRSSRRKRFGVAFLIVTAMTIAGAIAGPVVGWHPSFWGRVGNAAGDSVLGVLLALKVLYRMED